jgi:hypothetical protein
MESSYHVTHLRPKNRDVMLHDGSEVIVPVFDAKSMILDLLTSKITMDKSNIAEGYNVFTGDVDDKHTANKQYGEIHTSHAWLPAYDRFCTPKDDNNNNMPVGLNLWRQITYLLAWCFVTNSDYIYLNSVQQNFKKQHKFLETTWFYSQSWIW